ncbi:cation-translocating P-type ATPase [Archangium lansingense]|uniref:Cation-translocating P-type ATPase n=1 Tax=Archangium lansingense TaxID=2995310 RepID=A0ABT4AMB7_9BACT|nr:cation-translocating P-type ATPase [Archangium lansinium]MCY1082831.1 cation-translocating P-type ATPase [Archangium lansinium]
MNGPQTPVSQEQSRPTPPSTPRPVNTVLGLSQAEATRRLAEHGRNEIQREQTRSPWAVLLEQFRSPMIALLLGAGGVSALLGEYADALAIGAIVVVNALIGFLQEFKAEQALVALRSMTAPRARVMRDGYAVQLPSAEVVPGDVLLLEAGDVVAADAHLLEAHALATNEAALTGESAPVDKAARAVAADAPLAQRSDTVFLGTAVTRGTGLAEVRATGMRTELGKIAHLLASTSDTETPLEQRLAKVTRTLLLACLAVVVLVAALGLWRGQGWMTVLLSAISLAVAAVPEGLPAVVTIALALGVRRMAARHALVRRLQAVETLGSTTVVCTDKTGTLTTGTMEVREVWGTHSHAILFASAACCEASLGPDGKEGTGDPTELALLRAALARGIRREEIERERPRVMVRPFDSETKRMSVLRADGALYVKGALEVLLPRCRADTNTVSASRAARELAGRGLRVLAVAQGNGPEEENLELLGLVGMADPPRPEAVEAVAAARAAGVRTVMITGDSLETAQAIGRELGILQPGEDAAERIHARVTAEDKLRIVRSWKERGEVVAMTGDGVNDAPALREAHIGIAMGRTGTEVTREAADLVLTDDNFATIITAIHEGRAIYENIRKTLVYLLVGNVGELTLMLAASLVGLPMPLVPLQLLWINLVTDSLPALALVMDPARSELLARPPRRPDEPMLGPAQWRYILMVGTLEALLVLGVFIWADPAHDVDRARALAFSTLVFAELLRAFAARSATRIFWEVGPLTNRLLLGIVIFSVGLQVVLYELPAARGLFGLGALHPRELGLAFALGLLPVTLLEMTKLVRRVARG